VRGQKRLGGQDGEDTHACFRGQGPSVVSPQVEEGVGSVDQECADRQVGVTQLLAIQSEAAQGKDGRNAAKIPSGLGNKSSAPTRRYHAQHRRHKCPAIASAERKAKH
jgi:hypothetical protein